MAEDRVIEDYFNEIAAVVSTSQIIQSHEVAFDKRDAHIGAIRGDLALVDESRLHLREYVNLEADPVRLKYAYHYQDAEGNFIFRYDNTPHYPELPNSPHHKHEQTEATVKPSNAPTLKEVLAEIELRLK